MSSKARRRRPKSSARTRQAFEDDDNENQSTPQEISYEHDLSSKNAPSSTAHIDQNRIYEKALFTINDLTVEVILDNDTLCWTTVLNGTSQEEKYINRTNLNSVNLQQVYAITPIYYRWNSSLNVHDESSTKTISNLPSTESQLRGFELHTYEKAVDNILQEILIIFQSISPNQIEQWYQMLSKRISQYKSINNILVICNPYSGTKSSRHTYNVKIRPMLDRAHYNTTYFEIDDFCTAEDIFKNFQGDLETLYGLVIIGGDGSVINVINGLLHYLAKENQIKLDSRTDLPGIPFPICIIPTGTTNIICHSIHGNADPCTSILHMIFNHRIKIDMSAIFDMNYNFVTANFNTAAGYPATALQYFPRYASINSKKILQKSFAKAASNKNLKPINMEIRYIPADQIPVSFNRCYQGCSSCSPAPIEETDNQVKAYDEAHLKNKDKRKKSSSLKHKSTNDISSMNKFIVEKDWKILHQNYLQVAVLTNASLWSFAPQGLSKYGHLADGLLDLVLIKPTVRKEFLRYLKRNGNSKNQYEFGFTHLIKVKEIEIELKLPDNPFFNEMTISTNQLDSSLSDDQSKEDFVMNNSNKQSSIQKHDPHPPSAPLSETNRHRRRHHQINEQSQEMISQPQKLAESTDLDSSQVESFNQNASFRRKSIFKSLKLNKKDKIPLPHASNASGNEQLDDKQGRRNSRTSNGTLRPSRSVLSLFMANNSTSGTQDFSSSNTNTLNGRRASIISRSSTIDNENISTSMNSQHKKKKQICLWNLDFTPYNSPLIRIKCFYRFLPVFGLGLDPDTLIKEVNYSCFG